MDNQNPFRQQTLQKVRRWDGEMVRWLDGGPVYGGRFCTGCTINIPWLVVQILLFWDLKQSCYTAQKMKFSIKDFFSKCDQIRGKMGISSHLLKKSLMENFNFCALLQPLMKNEFFFADINSSLEDNCLLNFLPKKWKIHVYYLVFSAKLSFIFFTLYLFLFAWKSRNRITDFYSHYSKMTSYYFSMAPKCYVTVKTNGEFRASQTDQTKKS